MYLEWLIVVCGNIQNDSWKYVKPYVEANKGTHQKPYPRYGYAGVYIGKIDQGTNFVKK